MNRLAVFDCDGTLVDSAHSIYVALDQALSEHGLEVPQPERCRRVIGLSLVEAIADLVPAVGTERHVEIAATYKLKFHALRAAGDVSEPLFDGIVELLRRLEEDGWLLAVATGKSDRGLRNCLEANGIHPRFISLQTADRHPSKPHPSMVFAAMADAGASPDKTVVVGDTSFDMEMATAAGAHAIGVAWGYHDADELRAVGARTVASRPADVYAAAKELVG